MAGLAWIIVQCAWHSDDAWITFRTVKNAWAGHGLTWNPDQRVQAYTHPLWMMVGLVCYGLSGELYFSTLVVSISLSLISAVLLARRAIGQLGLPESLLLVLAASGAYVDYSTSGLENALLFALVAIFFVLTNAAKSHPLAVGLAASGIVLTRMDAVLLVLPVLFFWLWEQRFQPRTVGLLATAGLPFFAWEAFSLVYYGQLVPNTAIAKLNVDIPSAQLAAQGLRYLRDSLATDPVTLGATVLCAATVLWRGTARARWGMIGVFLYLLYVVRIGGDFMSGRFLAAPMVAALALLVSSVNDQSPPRHLPAALGVLALIGFAMPDARWRSDVNYGIGMSLSDIKGPDGIANERAYYYPSTGLLPVLASQQKIKDEGLPLPPYNGAIQGRRFAEAPDTVAVWTEAGFFGYFAGDKTVIDVWALGDPLLARLPFRPAGKWRVGHYKREIPPGYVESRESRQNQVQNRDLARAYDALTVVVSGPLFTRERWREIWRLNTGYYDGAFQGE